MGLLAAVAALLLGLASGQGLDVVEAQVLCASSVLTASLAACALGEWPSGSCRGWGAPQSSCPPWPGPAHLGPGRGLASGVWSSSAGGPWREGQGGARGTAQPPYHACRPKTPPSKPPHLPGPAFTSPPRPRVPRGLEPRSHLPDASGPSVLGPLRCQAQELQGRVAASRA